MKVLFLILGLISIVFSAYVFFFLSENSEHYNRISMIGGAFLPIGLGFLVAAFFMHKKTMA